MSDAQKHDLMVVALGGPKGKGMSDDDKGDDYAPDSSDDVSKSSEGAKAAAADLREALKGDDDQAVVDAFRDLYDLTCGHSE